MFFLCQDLLFTLIIIILLPLFFVSLLCIFCACINYPINPFYCAYVRLVHMLCAKLFVKPCSFESGRDGFSVQYLWSKSFSPGYGKEGFKCKPNIDFVVPRADSEYVVCPLSIYCEKSRLYNKWAIYLLDMYLHLSM